MAEKKTNILHCRMSGEDLAMIDRVKEYRGILSRTAAIRQLFLAEWRRIEAEEATKGKSREDPG